MDFSDTDSERNVVWDDMCLEPTLEVEESNYRGLAIAHNAFDVGVSGGHALFEKMEGAVGSASKIRPPSPGMLPLAVGNVAVAAPNEVSPAPGPPRFSFHRPQPPAVVVCTSPPAHFMPLVT